MVGPVGKPCFGPESYNVAKFEVAHKLAISRRLATAFLFEPHSSLGVVFRVDTICVAPDDAMHLEIPLGYHIFLDCEMILRKERMLEGIFPRVGAWLDLRKYGAEIVDL